MLAGIQYLKDKYRHIPRARAAAAKAVTVEEGRHRYQVERKSLKHTLKYGFNNRERERAVWCAADWKINTIIGCYVSLGK